MHEFKWASGFPERKGAHTRGKSFRCCLNIPTHCCPTQQDVKLENMLLHKLPLSEEEGGGFSVCAKVADFGLHVVSTGWEGPKFGRTPGHGQTDRFSLAPGAVSCW